MTEFTFEGLRITAQDLSVLTPEGEDDDRLYHHNGSNPIDLTGGSTTSRRGFYIWDADAGAWFPSFQNADLLDGKEAGEFLHRDGSLPMQADLDAGNNGIINLGEASGGTGGIHLNTNHVEVHSHTAGSNIRLLDSNGLLLLESIEGGNVTVPNGQLSEKGNRVATRQWTNANADVPNADYADEANTLDGFDQTAFLHVSGDQMQGVLDVGGSNIEDGGSIVWNSSTGTIPQSNLGGPAGSLTGYPLPNGDLVNSSITVTAGNQVTGGGSVSLGGSLTVGVDESTLDAATLDGYEGGDLAALSETESITGSWTFNTTPSVPNNSWSSSDVDYSNIPLSIPVTKWANGLSGEEIWRIELQAGESLEAHRLEIQPKGGGDVTGLEADLYEVGSSTILASTSNVTTGSPIASSADGATVLLRISNSSGSYQNASIGGELHLV